MSDTHPPPQPAAPAIYRALAAARESCPGYVRKDTSAGQGRGVSHDQVTAHIRQALIDAGVLVLPSLKSEQSVPTQSGSKPGIRYEAIYTVAFVAVEDGSRIEMDIAAHALGADDKHPGKTLSYATKSAELKALCIETGEDDESRVAPPEAVITAEEAADLETQAGDLGDKAAFLNYFGATSFEQFPARLFPAAQKMIEKKRETLAKAAAQREAQEAGDDA